MILRSPAIFYHHHFVIGEDMQINAIARITSAPAHELMSEIERFIARRRYIVRSPHFPAKFEHHHAIRRDKCLYLLP